MKPITVAARSEASTVFACWHAGGMGSNLTPGMNVSAFVPFVLPCV
jgi:hypothetical protein